jgi:hypothetical protein
LQELAVKDEGYCWEKGNEKLLAGKFRESVELIESFVSSIEIYPVNTGKSFEAYFA